MRILKSSMVFYALIVMLISRSILHVECKTIAPQFLCAGDREEPCMTGLCYDAINFDTGQTVAGCASFDMCHATGCNLTRTSFICCCEHRTCNGKSTGLLRARMHQFLNADDNIHKRISLNARHVIDTMPNVPQEGKGENVEIDERSLSTMQPSTSDDAVTTQFPVRSVAESKYSHVELPEHVVSTIETTVETTTPRIPQFDAITDEKTTTRLFPTLATTATSTITATEMETTASPTPSSSNPLHIMETTMRPKPVQTMELTDATPMIPTLGTIANLDDDDYDDFAPRRIITRPISITSTTPATRTSESPRTIPTRKTVLTPMSSTISHFPASSPSTPSTTTTLTNSRYRPTSTTVSVMRSSSSTSAKTTTSSSHSFTIERVVQDEIIENQREMHDDKSTHNNSLPQFHIADAFLAVLNRYNTWIAGVIGAVCTLFVMIAAMKLKTRSTRRRTTRNRGKREFIANDPLLKTREKCNA